MLGKYIRDLKIGKSWRATGKKERKVRRKKEGKRNRKERPKSTGNPSDNKKRWFRPGVVVLHEIRRIQKTMGFLIRKLSYVQWGKQIMQEQCGNLCFQATYLFTLQEVAKVSLMGLFRDANQCAIHMKWVTVMSKDIKLACRIWSNMVKYL